MKNIILLLFVFLSTTISAQFTFSDDFESYTAGDYIGEESDVWTTWSGATGGTEDVQVTADNANSGTNSTFYSSTAANGGPQDVVLPFGGQVFSSGDFTFSASFFVNPNAGAYFNLQAEVEIGQTWAVDCNMNEDGTIVLSTGGGGTVFLSSTYPAGEWFDLTIDVDLTINNWSLIINGENLGSFINTENEIASLDIFPLTGHQFYVDDIVVEHVPALLSSLDIPSYVQSPIDVEIAGTIFNYGNEPINSFDVVWTNGTDTYTSNYAGLDIASMSTYDFVCTDLLEMPNPTIENITVTAENVNGTTDFDDLNASIDHTIQSYEFVTQKIPLYEHFTSNTCGPCATFNPGFQDLLDANNVNDANDANANAIKFQVDYPGAADQSYNDDVAVRSLYYQVSGVPTAHIDGSETGSSQTNLDARAAIPCFLDITGTAVSVNGDDIEVNVSITSYSDYSNSKLYIAIVENQYDNNLGTNGETEFFQVHRKMLPTSAGVSVDLSEGSTIQATESTTFVTGEVLAGSFDLWQGLGNCVVVVFVQNDVTKEIYQSKTIDITGGLLGINENENFDFQIMPNPANDKVSMRFKSIESTTEITIYSITGQLVAKVQVAKSLAEQTIPVDISSLEPGIYSVKMQADKHTVVRQLIKQ